MIDKMILMMVALLMLMVMVMPMAVVMIVVLLQMLVAAVDDDDGHHGDDCRGTECLDSCTNLSGFWNSWKFLLVSFLSTNRLPLQSMYSAATAIARALPLGNVLVLSFSLTSLDGTLWTQPKSLLVNTCYTCSVLEICGPAKLVYF